MHATAEVDYPNQPFDDGWELELGSLRICAIHTPGHRPEHTAFALIDSGRGDEPWAVLTGDTLFVGDVARPDLAVDKEEGASDIFRSLHEKLFTLARDGGLARTSWADRSAAERAWTTEGLPLHDLATRSGTTSSSRKPISSDSWSGRPPASSREPPNFQAVVDLNRDRS